ncbi:hypothetical protein GO986_12135 [Deinococcus sp. HMF7620]|uniref:Uncharacterized protein n=1 Tax=Deinococcus arboris TaxID=2682977 RepID=A0A7C9HS43_9DEIO|nr:MULTISPECIES: hypothetical protein [Deinococcus]MBZ9752134.1 hypothetical protein [Deinococcus betulae]MVN87514.1 hypothetical protein [Deinococcus arboris]
MTVLPSAWVLGTPSGPLAVSPSKALAEEAAHHLSSCAHLDFTVTPLRGAATDAWDHPLPYLTSTTALTPILAVQVTFDLEDRQRHTELVWRLPLLIWEDARLWGTTLRAMSQCRVHAMQLLDTHLPLLQANLKHGQ